MFKVKRFQPIQDATFLDAGLPLIGVELIPDREEAIERARELCELLHWPYSVTDAGTEQPVCLVSFELYIGVNMSYYDLNA